MASKYITQAGDTWDIISKKIYGSELYADCLMNCNTEQIDIFMFDYGVSLIIPDLPEEQTATATLPSWR